MTKKLHYNTVIPLLKSILLELMATDEFSKFRQFASLECFVPRNDSAEILCRATCGDCKTQ